jgi:hypothetical protein
VPQSGADGVERGGSGTGSVEASDDVIGQVAALLPAGVVVSQAPPAGARAAQRTEVNVTLSLGPQVAVPPLIGKNVGDATTILRAAGLVLVSTRVEGAPGIVMEQGTSRGNPGKSRIGDSDHGRKIHATAPEGAAWAADSSDVIGLVIIGGRRSKIPPPSSG